MSSTESPARKRLYLLLLAAIQFIHVVDFMIIAPLGPQLMRLFGLSPEEFSYVFSAYTYSAGLMSLVATFFIDRFDRKRALLVAFGGLIVGTALCGLATSFVLLLVARVVAGLFGGLINALIYATVADLFGEARRGQALGAVMAAFSVATVAGVPLGLAVANWLGWEAPFLGVASLGMICAVAAGLLLPPLRAHLAVNPPANPRTPLAILARAAENPSERAALTLMFLIMLASFAVIPYISPYLVFNVGISEKHLAYVYLSGGLATLGTSPLVGRLADRLGKVRIFVWLAVGSGLVFVLLTTLPPVPLAAALGVTTLFFVTVSGRAVPALALVTSAVPTERRGGFMSLSSAVQQLTAGTAALVTGQLVQSHADGHLTGYPLAGGLAVVATGLALWVVRYVRPVADEPAQPVAIS